jgi:very-short-patch-repair endonuclease
LRERDRVREKFNNMKNKLTLIARKLRQNLTFAERKLWYNLRSRNFLELKFKRQEPIGNYIVDFVCYEKKLITEVDGGQNNEFRGKDIIRENWLKDKGFKILRFWNNEVLKNINGVLKEIKKECEDT